MSNINVFTQLYDTEYSYQIKRYKVTPPKNGTHIFLTEIHKFNFSLFFLSGYEVDSVHDKIETLVFTNMSWSSKEKN